MQKLPPHVRISAAQMDMTKTPAFRAVEELLKAQKTHMKLRREFEEAKLSEDIVAMKEVCIAQQAIPEILYLITCCQHHVHIIFPGIPDRRKHSPACLRKCHEAI